MAMQKLKTSPEMELARRIRETKRLAQTAPPITSNPKRMGGTPVIGIERMPVSQLIGHLMAGYTVDEFVDEFGVNRERTMAALERIKEAIDEGWLAEPVNY